MINCIATDFGDISHDVYIRNDGACHGTRRNPRRSFTRAGPATAAIIAKAVFGVIAVIGMARTIGLGDVGIILRPLVHIFDHQ